MYGTALRGLRVLDFTNFVAGPLATLVLADLGAEVIHVERPDGGDDGRLLPPMIEGQGYFFVECNRNKKSLALNLKEPEGRKVAIDLATRTDVLVENYRPGVMEALGLDYDSLKEANSRLVYCSVSGYGDRNSRRERPGYDPILQAYTGIMLTTGFEGDPPVRVGPSIVDRTAASWAALAIMSALYDREKTGKGQRVTVSLLGAAIEIMASDILRYLATGKVSEKSGSAGGGGGPTQAFPTSDDRFIQIAVGNDRLWQRFCAAIERPDLAEHPRYKTLALRLENKIELSELLQVVFRERPLAHWEAALAKQSIPSAPIRNVDEVVADEEIAAEFLMWAPLPNGRKMPSIKTPLDFAGGDHVVRSAPPLLGADTAEILSNDLGYSSERIEKLREAGVVAY
jgi:crotonobetainyl-CoA:carnitine CoA-transferase CaiB-like acyl-CoA transferase